MEKELEDKGVCTNLLGVVAVGGEHILGEIVESSLCTTELFDKEFLHIKNPKRFVRMQFQRNGAIMVDFLVGDLDLMDSGSIVVKPTLAYALIDQSDNTKYEFYKLYLNYLERRSQARAAEAGLHIPESGIVGAK
jgi:hypothetical protein